MHLSLSLSLGASGRSAVWTPAKLSGLALWLRADMGVTLNGSTVSAWADQETAGGAQDVVNASGATQPAYTESSASFNNQPVLTHVATRFLKASTAADWKFLHDGTGGTIAFVYQSTSTGATQLIIDTSNGSPGASGVTLIHGGGSQTIELRVCNGSGVYQFQQFTAGGTATNNAPHLVVVRYQEGAVTEVSLEIDGVQRISGSTAGTPSSSNPNGPLTIGSTVSGAFGLVGDVAEVVACNAYMPDDDLTLLRSYVSTRYGFAVA